MENKSKLNFSNLVILSLAAVLLLTFSHDYLKVQRQLDDTRLELDTSYRMIDKLRGFNGGR